MLGAVVVAVAALAVATRAAENPQGLECQDVDMRTDFFAGSCVLTRAANEDGVGAYAVYFSSEGNATHGIASKLVSSLGIPRTAVVDNIGLPSADNPSQRELGKISFQVPAVPIPPGAVSLMALSKDETLVENENTTAIALLSDTTVTYPQFCSAQTVLDTPTGAIDDGSAGSGYLSALAAGANYTCQWLLTNADAVDYFLSFPLVELHEGDEVRVYEGEVVALVLDWTSKSGTLHHSLTNNVTIEFRVQSTAGSDALADGFRATFHGTVPIATTPVAANANATAEPSDSTARRAALVLDDHQPLGCVCEELDCQGSTSNCYVDEGNGKGWATCANRGQCEG